MKREWPPKRSFGRQSRLTAKCNVVMELWCRCLDDTSLVNTSIGFYLGLVEVGISPSWPSLQFGDRTPLVCIRIDKRHVGRGRPECRRREVALQSCVCGLASPLVHQLNISLKKRRLSVCLNFCQLSFYVHQAVIHWILLECNLQRRPTYRSEEFPAGEPNQHVL